MIFGRQPGDFYDDEPPPAPKPEQLPRLFLRTWPNFDVPNEIMQDVRRAIDQANERLRHLKRRK